MSRAGRFAVVVLVAALLAAACSSGDDSGDATDEPADEATSTTVEFDGDFTFAGELPAAEFPAGLEWLNVDRPLSLAQDLRGKIVLLDFWTQGCINCLHIIPDLKRLEDEYAEELVVIGVHWAKFDRERQTEAIRQSVLRYGVEHPVVNDENEEIRATYGVQAWPSLVLIDPNGNGVGGHTGEGAYEVFQPVIDVMAEEYTAAGLIDPTPLDQVLESTTAVPTVLSFPGKVLADEAGDRLFVADSGHNRILVSDLSGELQFAIGSGLEGLDDGPAAEASFSRPQGMALSADGSTLYVADRENHVVRAVDLDEGTVSTVVGTGEPAIQFLPGPSTEVPLSSPWDLHLDGDRLFIAGAGRHQLWVADLAGGTVDVFAGTGAEGLDDGDRLATTLSQPSGFASDGTELFFTDPEASAIRQVDLGDDGRLETLIGDGLFTWGDQDGSFDDALLQHAVGVEFVDGRLFVADTYNHRIKLADLTNRVITTFAGDGTPGLTDGIGADVQLAEPSGLSLAVRTLYVADTNNHQIRTIDVDSAEVSTLAFSNLDVAALQVSTLRGDVVSTAAEVAPGEVELVVDYVVPDGYKFNTEGTFTFEWTSDDEAVVGPDGPAIYEAKGPTMPLRFDATASDGSSVLRADSTVYYCLEDEEAFCLIRDVTFEIALDVVDGAPSTIEVTHELPSAESIEEGASP